MNFRLLFTAPSLVLALALAGCGGETTNSPGAASPTNAETADTKASSDIVDTAVGAGSFKTLVAAVKAADLVDTLKGPGPFTVFAPTDEAFAKIDAATIEKLKTDSALLTSILTYHVVPGQATPAQVVGEHKTVQGATVKVTGTPDSLKVNDAGVVCGGVATTNAQVYLIDTVLMPPAQ